MNPAHALARFRAEGFTLELEGDCLMVEPLSRLTDEQRTFLRANKAALIQRLLEETAPATAPRPIKVTCSTCQHGIPASSDPWSWHSCGQGVDRATGWGMTPRKCERWEVRP